MRKTSSLACLLLLNRYCGAGGGGGGGLQVLLRVRLTNLTERDVVQCHLNGIELPTTEVAAAADRKGGGIRLRVINVHKSANSLA